MISFFELESQKFDELYELKIKRKLSSSVDVWLQAKIEACLELVGKDFNPNERDEDGETILSNIIFLGRLDLVKFLVEAGADVNLPSYDKTIFPLEKAARFGWQEIYDYLAPLTNPELVHIAQQSIAQGWAYQKRLKNRNEQVESLINAVYEGDIKEVVNFIGNGVDVNAIGFNYFNALHQACFCGQILIIKALLAAGADPNIKTEDDRRKTSLMISLDTIYYLYHKIDGTNIQLEIAKILIEVGADVNVKDADGNTALMYAISKIKNSIILTILIETGADINYQNNTGLTALMISAGSWAIPKECMKILLESGANINLRDN